jgi:hypothetical protein
MPEASSERERLIPGAFGAEGQMLHWLHWLYWFIYRLFACNLRLNL